MSKFRVNTPSMKALRRAATRLKRAEGIPHHEALERVARAEGYPNWHLAHRAESGVSKAEAGDFDVVSAYRRLMARESLDGAYVVGETHVTDPVTGFKFHKSVPEDLERAKHLRVMYRLFTRRHPSLQLLTYADSEASKAAAREKLADASLSARDRAFAAMGAFEAWYSRSAFAWFEGDPEDLLEHPGLDGYAKHLWWSIRAGSTRDDHGTYPTDVGVILDARFGSTPTEPPRIAPGHSYWTRASANEAPRTPSTSARLRRGRRRGISYGTPLGRNPKFRPARRMALEHHEEVAKIIRWVLAACAGRNGVTKPLEFLRHTLDDWVAKEYDHGELSSDRFFEMYYGDTPYYDGSPRAPLLVESEKRLARLFEVLVQSYEDCRPRQELLTEIGRSQKALARWRARLMVSGPMDQAGE